MSTWRRFIVGCVLGFFTGVAFTGAAAQHLIPDYQTQVIRNTQRLDELEKRINELDVWHDTWVHDRLLDISVQNSRVREIEVVQSHHERIIWILVTGVAGLLLKVLADFIAERQRANIETVEQHHPHHENHDDGDQLGGA